MHSHHALRRAKVLALLFPALLIGVLVTCVLTARPVEAASTHVDLMMLNSDTGPASLRLLTRGIDTAERDGAQALIIEIDTPGGDIDSMEKMVKAELASR